MTNFKLIQHFIIGGNSEWAVPMVYGKLEQSEVWDTSQRLKTIATIFYKKSITGIFPDYQNDYELFQQFNCGKEYETLDIFIGLESSLRSHQYVFSKFP